MASFFAQFASTEAETDILTGLGIKWELQYSRLLPFATSICT